LPTAVGGEPDVKAQFLRLCDAGCQIIEKQARATQRMGRAFYWDSYVVRALAVAHDMTDKREYLDACKLWSDRMIEYQSQMIPKGAYYMQYGRRPGEDKGDWYSADAACIGMAVLATAVRCEDSADKARYLASVESFAKLVIDNYVGPEGGITDGIWSKYDGQWWCSSGVFGSLAFLLYDETGEKQYLTVALGALDWLNRLDFRTVKHISFEEAAPSVIMYMFEAHSAGLPHLEAGSERHKETLAQISRALDWMSQNQKGRDGEHEWDYNSQWGSKLGGLPFHMCVYARHVPESQDVITAADRELRYIAGVLQTAAPSNQRDQLALFAMMSYAEKLSPGTIYRTSKRP
jgi:hypothetical protein